MARRKKRGVLGWVVVLGVVALAAFGVYTLANTDSGKTTIKAGKAGAEAAAKVLNKK